MDEQIDESVLCLELGSEESTKRMDAFDYFKPISIPYQKSKVDYNQFGRVNNYLKGCKWAPDGTCLISWSNDQQVRLFNLPTDLWQPPIDESKINQSSDDLLCALTIQESGLIYDACFNPIMNSNEPETCFFATTCAGQPIHLWDAYNGKLRASMKGLNQYEEIISAFSITIDSTNSHLLAGYNKSFKVFDLEHPNKELVHFNTCDKQNGQTGHISCLTLNPANFRVLAAGSYGRQIGLYSLDEQEQICVMLGQNAGLTQLQFSTDGRRLYSAGRKCGELLCWDMRNLGQILFAMKRPASTNQRLYFDLNASSSYLVSGDQSGQLNWWDVRSIEADRTPDSCLSPTMSWNCESDCLNSVSLHPTLPIVVTGSGQRHFGKLLNQNCEDADLVFSHTPNGQNWMRLWWSADLTQFNQVYSQSS